MQRRSFLKNATLGAVAGGATLAAPAFAQQAPTINWRLASSFPRSADAIYSGGENVAKYISEARSEEHTSELQSLMRISYAVFCLKKKKNPHIISHIHI